MKFPFEFGIKLVFRLIFPGIILALGFLPLLLTALDYGGWNALTEYVLGFAVVFLGWLVVVSDMPIYMLFEGRRFWPGPVKRFFLRRESRRLAGYEKAIEPNVTGSLKKKKTRLDALKARIEKRADREDVGALLRGVERKRGKADKDTQAMREGYFDLRNFPLPGEDYEAVYPTRLGNLLTAYEGYSTRVYGLDSVFYWTRLWLKVDEDTREQIDNSQALADSTVYASFALYCSAALWFGYAVAATAQLYIEALLPAWKAALPASRVTVYQHLPENVYVTWLLAAAFSALAFGVYRVSIRLHAQFGELFKALFDVHGPTLDLSGVMKEVSGKLGREDYAAGLSFKEQGVIVYRYLQHNRVRCPVCDRLLKPSEAAKHVAQH